MEIQIDLNEEDRTPEQNAKLERYFQATKILRAAGFPARTVLLLVSKSTDEPAQISLDRKS